MTRSRFRDFASLDPEEGGVSAVGRGSCSPARPGDATRRVQWPLRAVAYCSVLAALVAFSGCGGGGNQRADGAAGGGITGVAGGGGVAAAGTRGLELAAGSVARYGAPRLAAGLAAAAVPRSRDGAGGPVDAGVGRRGGCIPRFRSAGSPGRVHERCSGGADCHLGTAALDGRRSGGRRDTHTAFFAIHGVAADRRLIRRAAHPRLPCQLGGVDLTCACAH